MLKLSNVELSSALRRPALGSLFALVTLVSACSIESNVTDLQDYDINFDRENAEFTNKLSYEFEWKTLGKIRQDLNLEIHNGAQNVRLFKSSVCEGPPLREIRLTSPTQMSFSLDSLENQSVYTIKVDYANSAGASASRCSYPIVVDASAPHNPEFEVPTSNIYTGSLHFPVRLKPVRDIGIAGLVDDKYEVRLFGQPGCTGSSLETRKIDESVTELTFSEGITHGVFYSAEVVAIDRAGNSSARVCSPSIEIDTNIPTVNLIDSGSNPGFTKELIVDVITGNDGTAGYWCITEDTSFVPNNISDPCPGGSGDTNGWHSVRPDEYEISPGEGEKVINIWIARPDGELSSQRPGTHTVNYDTTPPGNFGGIGIAGGDSTLFDEWLNSVDAPIIRWTEAVDAVTYDLVIKDSSGNLVCSYSGIAAPSTEQELMAEDCTLLQDETYDVEIVAIDRAGNGTIAAPPLSFTVNTLPPGTFTIAGLDGGLDTQVDQWFSLNTPRAHWSSALGADFYNVSLTLKNDPEDFICSLDQQILTSNDFGFGGGTCEPVISGEEYRLYVVAENHAALTREATNNGLLVRADLIPPELDITSSPAALTASITASFSFTDSDALSGVESLDCQFNAQGWEPCTSPKPYSGLTQGDHLFSLRATDLVGNSTLDTYNWSVDTEGPVLSISSSPAAITTETDSEVVFTSSDPYGVASHECNLDSAGWSACSSPTNWEASQVDGTYELQVRAIDNVGNISNIETANWLVDTTDPVLAITSSPDVITASSTATFSFNANDGSGSGVDLTECSLNGAAFSSCASGVSYSSLAEQNHVFRVQAIDNAGNTSEPVSYSWDVYQSGPAMTLTSVPAALNNLTSLNIEFEGSVPTGVTVTGYQCSFDNGSWTSCSSPHNLTGITQGAHNIRVRGLDNLGNTGNHATSNWTTDLTAPTTIIGSIPTYTNSTSQSVSFTASDTGGASVAQIECSLDGAAFTTCASPLNLTGLVVGTHEIRVRATDSVGNVGNPTARTWWIDTTGPTVSLSSTPSNPTHNLTSFNFGFSQGDTGGSGVASVQCRMNSGSFVNCASPHTASFGGGSNTFTVRITDGAGNQQSASYTWTAYTYYWMTGSWSGCNASPYWSGWSACSASCGGGTQTRSCLNTSGNQYRTVTCQRNDGSTVSDSYCQATKPSTSQACSGSCSGSSSQSCNTQSCATCANTGSGWSYGYGSGWTVRVTIFSTSGYPTQTHMDQCTSYCNSTPNPLAGDYCTASYATSSPNSLYCYLIRSGSRSYGAPAPGNGIWASNCN